MTTGGGFTAVESVDGKYLYYKRGTGDDGELWKMPIGSGPPTKVLGSILGRLYTVTQRGIYFGAGAPTTELRRLDFATGSIQTIAPLGSFAHADVSADERWALYPQVEISGMNIMLAENLR